MNAETITPTKSTEIAIPEKATLEALLKSDEGLDAIITELEATVRDQTKDLDPAVAKDRDAMKSLAYKVSKSKVELEKRAKELTEQQRKEIEAVNAGKNTAVKRLEDLRDEAKKPAVEWEAKEKEREEKLRAQMDQISTGTMNAASSSIDIEARIEFVKTLEAIDFEDMADLAGARYRATIEELGALLVIATQREANEQELAKLRAEAEERRLADEKRQAEDDAKAEAERQKEQALIDERAEAERHRLAVEQLQIAEREMAYAAECAKVEAEEKAARDTAEAKARAERDKEAAIEAERKRVADQAEADRKAEAERAADVAHISKIRREAKEALMNVDGVDEALAVLIVLAINGKCIPHVAISY